MSTPEEKKELRMLTRNFSKETLARMYMKARAIAEKYEELQKLLRLLVKENE